MVQNDAHRDGVRIGGERGVAKAGALGLVLAPSRAVGPAGAVAAGAGYIDRGAARELRKCSGATDAVRHGEGGPSNAVFRVIEASGTGAASSAGGVAPRRPPRLLPAEAGSRGVGGTEDGGGQGVSSPV